MAKIRDIALIGISALLVSAVCTATLRAEDKNVAAVAETKLPYVFETDGTKEREEFPWSKTELAATQISDDTGDIVIFDQVGQRAVPGVIADLAGMTVTPGKDGWDILFRLKDPLPEDPGMPVNFDVFFDRDGDASNNAPDGVFRAGTDTAFLLLFGTRTKWHGQSWTFNTQTKRWQKQLESLEFKTSPKEFSFVVPYTVIPQKAGIKVRGFSLTSNNAGSTAVDVAPGKGLPPVRQ
jgi:hypothetical protein